MAHGRWISDEEKQQIVDLRREGVPVSAISDHIGRSTNFIYRILRKASTITPEPTVTTTKKQKTTASAAPQQSQRNAAAVSDSNEPLLCAVDSVEVSCEPIPFTPSTTNQEPSPEPLQPSVRNATVGFTTTPPLAPNKVVNSAAQAAEEFWIPSQMPVLYAPQTVATVTQHTGTDTAAVQLQPERQVPSTQSPSRDVPVPSIPSSSSELVVPVQLPMQQSQPLEAAAADGQESTLDELLKRIQDEIHRLENADPSDIYDAQLLQVLVKFQAEMRLVQLQRAHLDTTLRVKRARAEEIATAGKDIDGLLRERLEMEVALLNVQADREKLELYREQIKHQLTSMLCRRKLQDTDISSADLDWLLSRQ
ncbi:hypothetical protein PHYBOEH_009315 [Phytophthora boehmeriae]|uniref:Transposase IS30-like HTH domain-containing protein n=1 Tax=Phytophthora boehmeriae TaxID=109152 RepID=A0A8T1VU98_9STRA|nr:hypothetical protein PHYBOEH_009315 [Phytophthora boehmeriae]